MPQAPTLNRGKMEFLVLTCPHAGPRLSRGTNYQVIRLLQLLLSTGWAKRALTNPAAVAGVLPVHWYLDHTS